MLGESVFDQEPITVGARVFQKVVTDGNVGKYAKGIIELGVTVSKKDVGVYSLRHFGRGGEPHPGRKILKDTKFVSRAEGRSFAAHAKGRDVRRDKLRRWTCLSDFVIGKRKLNRLASIETDWSE